MPNRAKKTTKKRFFFKTVLLTVTFWILSVSLAKAETFTPKEVVDLTNTARQEAGLSALEENAELDAAAQEKATDMFVNNYFDHVSPTGTTPWNWLDKNGYDYHYAGENLAINFTNAKEQHEAWMQSPTHRKNILNPKYAEIGVAVQKGFIEGNESVITVQVFGLRAGQPVPALGKESDQKGQVLAMEDASQSRILLEKYVLWAIGVVLLLGIVIDLILIKRKHHHKTMVIVHYRP